MQVLAERIERDEYVIDPRKVADAILERLTARVLTDAMLSHDGEPRG